VKPAGISRIKGGNIRTLKSFIKGGNIRTLKVLYRRINEFKRGYQPRSNLMKDEDGDLLDSLNILDRLKDYFLQILNVHIVLLRYKLILLTWKSRNHQVVIKLWHD
jgi:hypothetical protein